LHSWFHKINARRSTRAAYIKILIEAIENSSHNESNCATLIISICDSYANFHLKLLPKRIIIQTINALGDKDEGLLS